MTNYEKLFGTPERAAEYLMANSLCYESDGCTRCSDFGQCDFATNRDDFSIESLLEWLKSEVRDD